MNLNEMINPMTPLAKVCKELSKGRYEDIFADYGVNVPIKQDGSCPQCGGQTRFKFDIKKGVGFCHNRQHKPLDVIDVLEKTTSNFKCFEFLEYLNYDIAQQRKWECSKARQKGMFLKDIAQTRPIYNYTNERNKFLVNGYHYGQCEYLSKKKICYPYSLINSEGHAIVDYFPFNVNESTGSHIYFHPDKKAIVTTRNGIQQIKGKMGVKGSSVKDGQYHIMNKPTLPDNPKAVVLCEGYGTAAAVWRILGGEQSEYIVLSCYSASTICNTARLIRSKMPAMSIIIAADHDYNNSGQMAANKIIEALNYFNVAYTLPNIPCGKNKYDWADIITDNDGNLANGQYEFWSNFRQAFSFNDLIPLYSEKPVLDNVM